MSMGLLIKDSSGGVIMDPDTFTVRLVQVLYLGAGSRSSAVRLSAPHARTGMFATACPNGQFSYNFSSDPIQVGSTSSSGPGPKGTRLPACRVEDGAVVLYPPMGGSGAGFDGNLHVYVFANI